MSNIEKKKVLAPKLRFKDFDGEWKQYKLGDISLKIQDGTHFSPISSNEGEFLYLTSKNIKNGYIELSNAQYISKVDHDNIYKRCDVKKGDIILTKDGTIGHVCVNEIDEPFSLLSSVAFLRPKKDWNNYFIYQVLLSPLGQKEITNSIAGQALKRITLSKINNFKYLFPPLPEQQKIASFLTAVDEKIQQLNCKKELLEQYKKGLMQQLFSGKLRFKDDNGKSFPKWDEKELSDLCEIARSGGTPQSTKKEFYDGEIPFLSISDMTSQGKYLKHTSNHISKLGLENSASWIVPANSIIYSMYASVGFVAINKIPIATSQAVLNLILKKEVDTEFTYYTLIDFQKRVTRFITTGTQGNLNAQTVKGFKIKLPCIEEQKKIADYLSNIDNKIESVNKQITQTQTFKKGLLQQMFV